jgi:hypothetical protein
MRKKIKNLAQFQQEKEEKIQHLKLLDARINSIWKELKETIVPSNNKNESRVPISDDHSSNSKIVKGLLKSIIAISITALADKIVHKINNKVESYFRAK